MFKNNHLAGVLNFRNGGASVPSFGGSVSLASALAAVERAEQALEAARSAAKAAAKREGKGVRNLFSDGAFVARSSAERWCDEARSEGVKHGCDILVRSFRMEPDPPFEHLVARLKRNRANGVQHVDVVRYWARLEAAGYLDAVSVGDIEKAARIVAEVDGGKVTGRQILRAAERARMSDDNERPLTEKDSLAARIIAAGKKRRNEV